MRSASCRRDYILKFTQLNGVAHKIWQLPNYSKIYNHTVVKVRDCVVLKRDSQREKKKTGIDFLTPSREEAILCTTLESPEMWTVLWYKDSFSGFSMP